MRILVIGSGGREHALAWKIMQSPLTEKIFCAPGNGGISNLAECVDIAADDISGLLDFARGKKIDLTVVGPEIPLTKGIVDRFQEQGLLIFGPDQRAAQIEGSKVFSKELMRKYNIPTAKFAVFDNPINAIEYIEEIGAPCVVKADGLAAGKGVVVAENVYQAEQAVKMIMQDKAFGASGNKIIIEECLQGQEASILVITDSRQIIALASSQDHKRIFDFDAGPNTGGMGAYSPAPVVTEHLLEEVINKIIRPAINGLLQEGITYKGVLYAGIMSTSDGPKTLEFNARFGDPETQVILPRLKSDLVELMLATAQRALDRIVKSGGLVWDPRACVCVVCSAGGYPGHYDKGQQILGLEEANQMRDVEVFHSGTQKVNDKFLTSGGRVLAVTALGVTIKEAVKRAYEATYKINFTGMHYRKDIGARAV